MSDYKVCYWIRLGFYFSVIQMFFMILFSIIAGGSAAAGKIENGVYYLGSRGGNYHEVSELTYQAMKFAELASFMILFLGVVAVILSRFICPSRS